MESPGVHQTAQIGFSKPDLYEKVRPTYQPICVQHLISLLPKDDNKAPLTVIDLAAGTGKLTRCLAPYFQSPSKLIAVEPVPGMRSVFSKVIPEITILEGSAESIPFPNSSLDAIFIGQAFHWFAKEASLKEFHRVLKPGAPVAMIWNMEDKNVSDWVFKIRKEYEEYDVGCPQYRHGKWSDCWKEQFALDNFSSLESQEWKWEMVVSRDYIWDRVASKSYIASLDEKIREELKVRIQKIVEDLPKEGISYPHASEIAWAFKK